jgi:hypothetical protein
MMMMMIAAAEARLWRPRGGSGREGGVAEALLGQQLVPPWKQTPDEGRKEGRKDVVVRVCCCRRKEGMMLLLGFAAAEGRKE